MQVELTTKNMDAYWQLMRMDKPVGIYLLLWPTLWALIIAAQGLPPLALTLIFVAGVVVMRSAGCVINDYADRKVDGSVERTAQRPIVSGRVTATEALQLFGVLILFAFILVLFLNWQTILLSIPAVLLAASYPFMKRYTHMPQAVLGMAFGWAIPMACAAVLGEVPLWGGILFVANLCWTIAYDTMYAMVDRNDDVKIGVKSSAILFGKYDRHIIGGLQLGTIVLLTVIAEMLKLTWPVYLSILCCVGLFAIQQRQIVKRERMACFQAFLDNHQIGMVFTVGLLMHYLLMV
ncbi:4-hydroxybenzoate octaprenyltransferase [Alteromonas sp. ASW11-130]|uniref:4-hydroxybenzoate octaprenyltransferase n=1 Tax=Alteromonas sp. ASW11-130 TaxID=3015775 RepID=UPI002241912E|nr:4-hydroxybenzoate octaprenyltransferase [Alteromonas sp. ASW11-130]MCW8091167.1 4-hydroxybenzoate octaprenyltransferase [Alteromonas sp. ASW11-130]